MERNDMRATQGKCNKCGFLHPPLPPGQDCIVGKKVTDSSGKIHNPDMTMVTLKTIYISQTSKKEIKNFSKFDNALIIALTDFILKYEE